MRHYQNRLTGEVVSEDEYAYAAAQKGNWGGVNVDEAGCGYKGLVIR